MADPLELVAVGLIVMAVTMGLAMRRWRPPSAKATQPPATASEAGEAPVGRNLRGLLFALVALPLSCWLALSVGWASSDRPLPVRPPGPPSSCSGSSSEGDLLWLLVVGLVLLFQLGPSLVGFLLGRRKSRQGRPLPDGHYSLRFGVILSGVALLATVVRLVLGGVPPEAFTTYGALTPPGAKGWRTEQVIARQLADSASFTSLAQGEPLPSDMRRGGSCMSMGPHEVPGLKAWIGEAPVNIVRDPHQGFLVQALGESTVDPARRPRFDTGPLVAKGLGKGNWVLQSLQADGSLLAVSISADSQGPHVYLRGVDRRQVGLLLRPPYWPGLIALALAVAALLMGLGSRRLAARGTLRGTAWAAAARLGATFLLAEASLFLYGAYRLYF